MTDLQPIVATFKLVIVGDGGTGKTTFIRQHLTGEFEERYVPTVGVDVHPLTFHTNRGKICFNCWDVAGQDKLAGYGEGYYINGNCAIIMFDVTSENSLRNVVKRYRDIIRICDSSIPIVIVGNKSDHPTREITDSFKNEIPMVVKGVKYIEISTKSNINCDEPFVWMAKRLANDPDLYFLGNPNGKRSPRYEETKLSADQIASMEVELRQLENDFEI